MALFLKNKFASVLFSIVIVLMLAQCSGSEKQEGERTNADSSCAKKPVNPNGDSELALLMREMKSSAESLKEKIKQGSLQEKFPEQFLKIHTAKPTHSETKKESFDRFATNYINNLQILYQSPKEDLTKNYNAVITSCESCHSENCPGPLKAIKKLRI